MIKKAMTSELVMGSLILFVMFNLFNFLNFLFQFLMARMLNPVEYGILAVLISFLYFITIPGESIQLVISKYTSRLSVKKEYGKIKYLISRTIVKSLFASLAVFVLILIFSPFLGELLKIPYQYIIILGLTTFLILPLMALRGGIQGMKKFNSLGISMNVEAFLKVFIAIFLVMAGWKVYGALAGLILGSLISFVFTFVFLKKIIESKKEKIKIPKIYESGSQVLFVLIAVMVFQSIDIILSRIFFSELLSGQYAVANLTGKIIFFGTVAISKAMFPISSEKGENGDKKHRILYKSLGIVILLCMGALIFYGSFPELIIKILFGPEYLAIAPIIFNLGIGFSFIALTNLVLLYATSINKKIRLLEIIGLIFIQIILLFLLSQNLYNYSLAMAFSGVFMFLGSLLIITKKRAYKKF